MILGVQLMLPAAAPPAEPPGLAPRRERPTVVPPVLEYAAVLASPIFAPDRRPGASTAGSERSGGSLAGYAALGGVAGRGVASAVVSAPGGAIKSLRAGEDIDGWRLVGVDRTRLYFTRNGVRRALVIGAPAEPATVQAGASDTTDATPGTDSQ
jgi:hypothetical protein